MTVATSPIIDAACSRSNRSRMMARPMVCRSRRRATAHARDDEARRCWRRRWPPARRGREREPREHDRPAAEAVRQRAEHELRHGQAQQIERDRELDGGGVGGELGHQAGDRRHQDVERERADAGHGDQQRQQPPRRAPRRARPPRSSSLDRAMGRSSRVQPCPSGRVAAASQARVSSSTSGDSVPATRA